MRRKIAPVGFAAESEVHQLMDRNNRESIRGISERRGWFTEESAGATIRILTNLGANPTGGPPLQ